MIRWLYRYVFRGLGVLMLVVMLTILFLAINSQGRRQARNTDKSVLPVGTRH